MLIHTSLPAYDPELVSRVLCEVAGGKRCNFPYPGGYYIGFDDESSTAIEIYPIDTQLRPGTGGEYGALEPPEQSRQNMVRYIGSHEEAKYIASHIALTTPLSLDEIYAVAKREGWRAAYCSRRESFRLVEFWLENRILVELILEQDLADAIAALKVDAFDSDHQRLGIDLTSGEITKNPD
jgi:hypothetical protein